MQKIEAIGRLAGGGAHDFNNVLTVVLGRCQLLLARHKPEDPVYQDLEQIEITAQRAANLTRQLLAFGRNQTLTHQTLDLNGTVTGISDMLERRREHRAGRHARPEPRPHWRIPASSSRSS